MPLGLEELNPQDVEDSKGVLDTLFTPIKTLGYILDTPSSILRGVLAGKDLEDITSGIFSPEKRTTGRDVLSNLGFSEDTGKIGDFDLGSLLTEIAVDPLIFTSSLTGLTKAGKAAQTLTTQGKRLGRVEQILKNVQIGSKLNTLEEAGKIAPEAYKIFQSSISSQSRLLNEGVEELAGTVGEQIAKGQRGVGFSIPFTDKELVPIGLNKAIAPVIEGLNTGWNKTIGYLGKATKPITKAFSTKALTEEGQFVRDMNDFALSEANIALEPVKKDIQDQVSKIVNDIGKSPEEAHRQIINGLEYYGKPESIELYFKNAADLENEKLTNSVSRAYSKYDVPIQEGTRALQQLRNARMLDEDSLPAFWEQFEKEFGKTVGDTIDEKALAFDKSIKDLQGRRDRWVASAKTRAQTNLRKLYDQRNDLLDKALASHGLIGHNGTIPEEFVKTIQDHFSQTLDLAKQNGVIIEGLDDFALNYIPRIRSPRANDLVEVNEVARKLDEKVFRTWLPNSKERQIKHIDLEATNKMFREKLGIDFDWYETDPTKILIERLRRTNQVVANARNANAAIQFLASSEEKLGSVHIVDVLKDAGMHGFIPKGGDEMITWGIKSSPKDIKELLRKKGVKDVWLPADAAKDLMSVKSYSIGDLENIFRLFDPINHIYRSFYTTVPAYTGTNLVGNMWMNSLVGLLPFTPSGIKKYKDATSMLLRDYFERNPDSPLKSAFKWIGGGLNEEERLSLNNYKTFGGGNRFKTSEIQELQSEGRRGKISKFLSGDLEEGVSGKISKNLFGFAREVNNLVEEGSKFAHFLHRVEQGDSVVDAGLSVKKYLFDYKDLTGFEKKVMRRLVLFYTFARKNLPLAVSETLLNRQAYLYSKVPLSLSRTEDFVPDYILDQGNIRVGPGHYIDLKQPFWEANRFSPQGGGLTRVLDKVAQQLNPWIKAPLEVLAGKEFFRGLPLESLNRLPERTFFGAVPSEVLPTAQKIKTKYGEEIRGSPILAEVLRNLPWTRQEQIYKDVASEDIKPVTSMFGLRERQLSPEKLKLQKLINNIDTALGNDPSVRKFSKYYSIEEEPSDKIKNLMKSLQEAQEKRKSLGI